MQGLISFFGNMRPSASVCTPVGVGGGELDMDIIVSDGSGVSSTGLCLRLVSASNCLHLSINNAVPSFFFLWLNFLLFFLSWQSLIGTWPSFHKSNNAPTTIQWQREEGKEGKINKQQQQQQENSVLIKNRTKDRQMSWSNVFFIRPLLATLFPFPLHRLAARLLRLNISWHSCHCQFVVTQKDKKKRRRKLGRIADNSGSNNKNNKHSLKA